MSVLMWSWAAVYLVGHLALWQLVDREWRDPTDERREDGIGAFSPPPEGALTAAGERWLRLARPWTVVGFCGWCLIVVLWFAS